MALVRNHQSIQVLQNGTVSDFYQVHGMDIAQVGEELIQRAVANQNAAQDSRSVPSPFGESIALVKNILNANKAVSDEANVMTLIMYLRMSETAYTGEGISFHIRNFDINNSLDAPCIRDMKRLEGWKNDPDKVLYLRINKEVCGIFMPDHACFLPSAGFCEDIEREIKDNTGKAMIHGIAFEDFIKRRPEVKNRCRALLTTMIENGADNRILSPILDILGGKLNTKELEKYLSETKPILAQEINNYISKTCPSIDVATACGYPGRNSESRLLDTMTLIYTGENPIMQGNTEIVCREFVAIPPVNNKTIQIAEATYTVGETKIDDEMPPWIEFSAILDGTLHSKVYPKPFEGWRVREPEKYIDLIHGIPDGILSKRNYLINDVPAGMPIQDDQYNCHWEIYPEDPAEYVVNLKNIQYKGEEWKTRQRSLNIERLELWEGEKKEENSRILGCLFPEGVPHFKHSSRKAYVAIDPAGAESVRLFSYENDRTTKPIEYENLVCPITPISGKEMDEIIEREAFPTGCNRSHFESLLQMFDTNEKGFEQLWVKSRIWKMKEDKMFDYLIEHPEDMESAMSSLGVIANPKEMISRLQEKTENSKKCETALRHYIGILIMESILAMAKEGCSIENKNLKFLISYPENGSEEGITKKMKDAITDAIGLVNSYLAESNTLKKGENVTLYSESEASAQWHKDYPPDDETYMGSEAAAGTPDYGHSTHDFSLRIRNKLYMFSLPYAAQYITNATLAKVYKDRSSELMHCFREKKGRGRGQAFMKKAETTISEAMKSENGKLYRNLGFVLPLNQLFSNCTFCVTEGQVDFYQEQVQQIVEARLNVAIPAYADCIVRAIRDGEINLDNEVLLAPVGKGSLAINNVAKGFEHRFSKRIVAAINKQLSESSDYEKESEVFTGRIRLLPNNDTEKVSVAQGLIGLKNAREKGKGAQLKILSKEELVDHYLGIIYFRDGEDGQTQKGLRRKDILNSADDDAQKNKHKVLMAKLYSEVFESLMNQYTYQDFEESFNCWGYIGTSDGEFDESVRKYAKEKYQNLKNDLKDPNQSRRDLVMACPGREKEMICSALIDLIIERMPLNNDYSFE